MMLSSVFFALLSGFVVSNGMNYNCPPDRPCMIDCSNMGSNQTCTGYIINATLATSLTLQCPTNMSCYNLTTTCPDSGSCGIFCTESNSCNKFNIYSTGSSFSLNCNSLNGTNSTNICQSISINIMIPEVITTTTTTTTKAPNNAKQIQTNTNTTNTVYINCISSNNVDNNHICMDIIINTSSSIIDTLSFVCQGDYGICDMINIYSLYSTFTNIYVYGTEAKLMQSSFTTLNSINITSTGASTIKSCNFTQPHKPLQNLIVGNIIVNDGSLSDNNRYSLLNTEILTIESNDYISEFLNNYISVGLSRGELNLNNINGAGGNSIYASEISYFNLICNNFNDICGNIDYLMLYDAKDIVIDIGESINFTSTINASQALSVSITIRKDAYLYGLMLYADYVNSVTVDIDGQTKGNNTIMAANADLFALSCNNHQSCDNNLNLYMPPQKLINNEYYIYRSNVYCNGFGCNKLNVFTLHNANDINFTISNCSCNAPNYTEITSGCFNEWTIKCGDNYRTESTLIDTKTCNDDSHVGSCCGDILTDIHSSEAYTCPFASNTTYTCIEGVPCIIDCEHPRQQYPNMPSLNWMCSGNTKIDATKSTYLYVNCSNDMNSNCNNLTVLCPEYQPYIENNWCQVDCRLNNSCNNLNIFTQKTQHVILNCNDYDSCNNAAVNNSGLLDSNQVEINCLEGACSYLNITDLGTSDITLTCTGDNACSYVSLLDSLPTTRISLIGQGGINNSIFTVEDASELTIELGGTGIISNNMFDLGNIPLLNLIISDYAVFSDNNIQLLTGIITIALELSGVMQNNTFNASGIGIGNEIKITNDGAFIGQNDFSCADCYLFELLCIGGIEGLCGDPDASSLLNLNNSDTIILIAHNLTSISGYDISGNNIYITGKIKSNINNINLNIYDNGTINTYLANTLDIHCINCGNFTIFPPQINKAQITCYNNTGCNTLNIYTKDTSVTDRVIFNVIDCPCRYSRGSGCISGEINLYCGNNYELSGVYGADNYWDCNGDCCGDISSEFLNADNCPPGCSDNMPCAVNCNYNSLCNNYIFNATMSTSLNVFCTINSNNQCDDILMACPINQNVSQSNKEYSCKFDCNTSNMTTGCNNFVINPFDSSVVDVTCSGHSSSICNNGKILGSSADTITNVTYNCLDGGICGNISIINDDGFIEIFVNKSSLNGLDISSDFSAGITITGNYLSNITNTVIDAQRADNMILLIAGNDLNITNNLFNFNRGDEICINLNLTGNSILNNTLINAKFSQSINIIGDGGVEIEDLLINGEHANIINISLLSTLIYNSIINVYNISSYLNININNADNRIFNMIINGSQSESLNITNNYAEIDNLLIYGYFTELLNINNNIGSINNIQYNGEMSRTLNINNNMGSIENAQFNVNSAKNININNINNGLFANSIINGNNANQLSVYCQSFENGANNQSSSCNNFSLMAPSNNTHLICDGYGCKYLILNSTTGANDINITAINCDCDDDIDTACIDKWKIYCKNGNNYKIASNFTSANKCVGDCCGNVIKQLHIEECKWPDNGSSNNGKTGAIVGGICGAILFIILVVAGIYWYKKKKTTQQQLLLNDDDMQ